MDESGVDREQTGRVGVIPAGRRSAVHLLALDIVVMLSLIGFGLGNLFAGAWQPPRFLSVWVAIVFLVLAGVPVVLRRFWPVAAFRGGLVAGVVAILLGAQWAVALDIGLALYVVVAERPRRQGIRSLAAALAVTLLAPLVSPGVDTLGEIAFSWAVLIACAATGIAVQERRGRVEANMLRRERQAVAEERLRIARELHDVVAHSMSLITVKAAVANHVAVQHPEQAREALQVIEATSRDGLAELRRMLGVLRSEDDPDGDLAPAPTVADLAGLVERAGSAGVTVSLDVRGADALPDAVGLTVYRIVQEAVTNVIKHAGPANCAVTVVVADGLVRIEVTDDGSARSQEEAAGMPGHGLIGMRERVTTYAGSFHAAPRPSGGFAVTATLPFTTRGTDRADPAAAREAETSATEHGEAAVHGAAVAETEVSSAADSKAANSSAAARSATVDDAEVGHAGIRDGETRGAGIGDARVDRGKVGDVAVAEAGATEAELGGARLGEAELTEAELGEAELGEAELGEARLDDAELSEAELSEVELDEVRSGEFEVAAAELGEAGLGGAGLGHGLAGQTGAGDVAGGDTVVGEGERSGSAAGGIGVGVTGPDAARVSTDNPNLGEGGA